MTTKQQVSASPSDAAWAAVAARDRSRDGAFVYAVSSTRIYCRPSCPSRRPRRANVTFFDNPEAAERAGYRACHRCLPRSVGGTLIEICVAAARDYLDAHLEQTVTLERLAKHVGVSPFHLQRAFKARFGLSPKAYVGSRRLEQFKSGVRNGASVSQAIYASGFGSPRGLYERAARGLGMTPATYRRGGDGIEIRYAISDCTFGALLVATTERGVCAVLLGSRATLERELRKEFPRARFLRADAELASTLTNVIASIEHDPPQVRVRLDLQGSDFQRRVWTMLQRIPRGETRSYRQVAQALGQPSATRAVAHACAANKLAILVPCHRVVRADGELGGYRWGLARKRALIARERG